MIRFYLGEEPRPRPCPPTTSRAPACLREALERFDELVVKPRVGHGGARRGHRPARPPDGRRAPPRRAVIADPSVWVAQPMVCLSTHPTVIEGRLEPRHVDLRPFVLQTAAGARTAPGALTRVAFDAGALVVNSSQNGGGKDTWVPAV